MRITAGVALTVLCAASAEWTSGDSRSVVGETVEIRVRNVSSHFYNRIRMDFGSETRQFGALESGGESPFHSFTQANRSPFIVVLSGDRLYLGKAPIDGEVKRLEPGHYTFELNVTLEMEGPIEMNGILFHGYVQTVIESDAGGT